MNTRVYKVVAVALATTIIASVAAPGLTLHNCRQFGTKSTQLCACCEAEIAASSGCCAKKSAPAPVSCHEDSEVESACCFTSYEGPFEFSGQQGAITSVPTPEQSPRLDATCSSVTTELTEQIQNCCQPHFARHSSDPPTILLIHSFRC